MSKDIRVVVVDDHLVVRKGLRLMLEEASKGFVLVGEASSGEEAPPLVEDTQPDVILMDVRMPGMGGIEAIEHLRRAFPSLAIIMLTAYNEDELMLRGLQAGVCGYLLKDVGRDTLFHAIRAAAQGEVLMQPETMARLLSYASPSSLASRHKMTAPAEALTDREREILAAVVRGERNKEIAAHLAITESTVKAHLTTIYAKLGVDSRASAVAAALERDLLR